MHICPYQGSGENPQTIIVAYIPTRGGDRKHYLACSVCDSVWRWPNYARTSPAYEKK